MTIQPVLDLLIMIFNLDWGHHHQEPIVYQLSLPPDKGKWLGWRKSNIKLSYALYCNSYYLSEINLANLPLKAIHTCKKPCIHTVEVGSLHTLRLESLKLIFQPLHKFIVNKLSFWQSVMTSPLCMTQVIFQTIVYRQIISLYNSLYHISSGSEVYIH